MYSKTNKLLLVLSLILVMGFAFASNSVDSSLNDNSIKTSDSQIKISDNKLIDTTSKVNSEKKSLLPSIIKSEFKHDLIHDLSLEQDFTFLYDRDMNINTFPTIEFYDHSNWGLLGISYTIISQKWESKDLYKATYRFEDLNKSQIVNFVVTGAKDSFGNVQEDFNNPDNFFTIDHSSPVSLVEVDNRYINFFNRNQTITAKYTMEMNPDILPKIAYKIGANEYPITEEGEWRDNKTEYVVSYTYPLYLNSSFAKLKITDAESLEGIKALPSYSETFSIKTNPTNSNVVDFNFSENVLTNTLLIQTFKIVYDSDMNILVNPELKFYLDSNFTTPIQTDYNYLDSNWLDDNRTYTVKYVFNDQDVNELVYTNISSAVNIYGYPQNDYNSIIFFRIDTIDEVVITPSGGNNSGGGRRIYSVPNEPLFEEVVVEEIPEEEILEEDFITPTPVIPEIVTPEPEIVEETKPLEGLILVTGDPQNSADQATPLTGFATLFNEKGTTIGLVIILLLFFGYIAYRFTTKIKKQKK